MPVANIPVVDLANSDAPQQIFKACTEHGGFFWITNHGVPPASLHSALSSASKFFCLPRDAKMSVGSHKSHLRRGYTPMAGPHNCGAGRARSGDADGAQKEKSTHNPDCSIDHPAADSSIDAAGDAMQSVDLKESYTIGAEGSTSPMHGDNQLPHHLVQQGQLEPGWCEEMREVWQQMLACSRRVATVLGLSLGLGPEFFPRKMLDPAAQMVLLTYPPPHASHHDQEAAFSACSQAATAAATGTIPVGCAEHTDVGFMTFVIQDAEGLQVVNNKGDWVEVPVMPSTHILVNLGDLTARWTNDLYRSTLHRVVNHGSVKRQSLVFFSNCDFDAMVDIQEVLQCQLEQQRACQEQWAMSQQEGHGSGAEQAEPAEQQRMQQGCDMVEKAIAALHATGEPRYPPIKAGHYMLERLGIMWHEEDNSKQL